MPRTPPPDVSLKERLIERITLDGPMSVADYMHLCLLDPHDGYYTRHVAFGEDGDFITAPMVSQMFGEMIGVWVAQVWRNMGAPEKFRLVEVGAGRGELMSDVLRVIDKVPGMRAATEVAFVEPSPVLAAAQADRFDGVHACARLEDLPTDTPMILIANEVLDCLPARQFVLSDKGWCERRVGVRDGELVFGLVETPDFAPPFEVLPGETVEISYEQARFARQLAEMLKKTTGAALLIDYGRDAAGSGDTLQALHRHRKSDPLAAPGEHDLTMWADFPVAIDIAIKTGVKHSPVFTQAEFLTAMGIRARCEVLIRKNPGKSNIIKHQYERLTAPDQMGDLFKVVAMAFPHDIALPSLEDASAKD